MNKGQLLKHLRRAAEQASTKKKLNGLHVSVIVDELQAVWAKSLQETGSASMHGFGRFDVHRGTGAIKFTPSKLWKDKISGEVSSSAEHSDSEEDDDEDNESPR